MIAPLAARWLLTGGDQHAMALLPWRVVDAADYISLGCLVSV